MKELYLISGLGADQRVFDYLDLSGYSLNFIHWIAPEEDENISDYANRLITQIKTPRPVLIGVSFGGMIAIEIGKLIETEKIILISSVKTRRELPFFHRLTGRLKLNKLMPKDIFKKSERINYWLFGAKNEDEKRLLKVIIEETDNDFFHWAINVIVTWNEQPVLNNVIQIHGTSDRILPNSNVDFKISGGSHFMIVNRATEISDLISKILIPNP